MSSQCKVLGMVHEILHSNKVNSLRHCTDTPRIWMQLTDLLCPGLYSTHGGRISVLFRPLANDRHPRKWSAWFPKRPVKEYKIQTRFFKFLEGENIACHNYKIMKTVITVTNSYFMSKNTLIVNYQTIQQLILFSTFLFS